MKNYRFPRACPWYYVIYAFYLRKRWDKTTHSPTAKAAVLCANYRFNFLVLCVFMLYLALRLIGLGYDMSNSDAARWHRRSEKFLTALKTGDFASTYQHYQPGITMMWLNAVVKQTAFSYQMLTTKNPKTLENADWFPIIDGLSKAVNVATLSILLGFHFYLLTNLFNKYVGLMYVFLVAVEPYLIGIDRWFHLTSFEGYFAFSAVLGILMWRRTKSAKFLIFTSIFFVLGVYSKLTAALALPVLLIILIQDFVTSRKLAPTVIFCLTSALLFFLLLPALWVSPLSVAQKFYTAIFSAVSDDVRAYQLAEWVKPIYYFVLLGYKLSPFTLFGAVIVAANSKKLLSSPNVKYILLYLAVYFGFLSLADKKIDRYVIPLILPILLLLAVYLDRLKVGVRQLIVMFPLLFVIYATYIYFPMYSAYYSPLFGGAAGALKARIYENSGEYFAQAAFYLNTLGRNKKTFVPHNIESFLYYYKGEAVRDFDTGVNYIVSSLDIDRSVPDSYGCSLNNRFSPKGFTSVYVYECP